jgi:glycine/D-amino acid oxidase-like deaminating enzyme
LQKWGYPAEWVSISLAREIEPALDLTVLEGEGVAFFAKGAWYQPGVFARALLGRASRLGTRVHERDPVTAIKTRNGRVVEVGTAAGRRMRAGAIVNCAGPDAAQLAALAGLALPLQRIPGLVAVTTPVSPRLRTIVSAADLHARPHRDRLLLHSWRLDAELGPGPTWPNAGAMAERLLHQARGVLRGLVEAELQTASVGVRPVPPDGLPIVGFDSQLENLYTVVAHSAVHLAPVLGRLAARELTVGRCEQLQPFRPDRLSANGGDGRGVLDESTRAMLDEMRTTTSQEPADAR